MEEAFVFVYLFLTTVTMIFGDFLKVILVLGVVPFSMFFMKMLFSAENVPESTCKPETQVKILKRPPKSVVFKHIAPYCQKFSDAEKISAHRETTVSMNHVFRISPNGFEYCEKEDTYISELCPYYRCKRINDGEFKSLFCAFQILTL